MVQSDGVVAVEPVQEMTLPTHEAHSQMRFEKLLKTIKKGNSMTDKVSVDLAGLGALAGNGSGHSDAAMMAALMGNRGDGLGFGNGGLGLIALLALLGRNNGLFGNGVDGTGTGINNLANNMDTNAILGALGDIKASVPLAACQTQQTVQGAAANIESSVLQQTIGLSNQIAGAKEAAVAANNQTALLLESGFNGVGDKVDTLSAATALGFGNLSTGIERNGWQISQAIANDGEKTRALIQSIDKTNDSRLITAQANEIAELRNEQRRQADNAGIRIDMINNQNSLQQQQQQQGFVLNHLANALADVSQIARATNTSIIAGNSGAVGGAYQTANPTNVRA